jgi:hypothetical protein
MWMEALALTLFVVFGVYGYWYFFVAKIFEPLTREEADIAWQLHKKQKNCEASRIKDLLEEGGKIVGFRCECGHEFKQTRLITQKARKRITSVECPNPPLTET